MKEKLDLKVYFDNGLDFKTNDLYVILQMGSLTGFYSIFRLNVNLFVDYPMQEDSQLFRNTTGPVRSDKQTEPVEPEPKPEPAVPDKQDEPAKEKPEEKKQKEHEDLKRKSIATFKRSKSKHIINQYGQIVGIEKMSDEEKLKSNRRIRGPDAEPKPKSQTRSDQLAHNIFHPNESSQSYMEDLYGTEHTFDVKHVKHAPLNTVKHVKRETDADVLPQKERKTTMRVGFSRRDVDKAHAKIPTDFEIIFNFRCLEESPKWLSEWAELEHLRNEIIRKLESKPDKGYVMINGKH